MYIKKCRLQVGAQALNLLIDVLRADRDHTDLLAFALDTLNNIMSPRQLETGM